YTVTVTDGHGCKTDTSVIITNPPPIVLSTDSTPSLCNKTDGSASITATGGTPGFTYKWSTGATTSSITNVAAGNYCVLILDANKCRDSSCINVPNISGDSIKIIAITNVTCNGGNNGSIVASVTGGTGPFTYAWTPSGGNTTTATNLSAGTYTITVTDNNGCPATAMATVKQPPPITITAPGQTICIGQTATLTATANGGTAPYTYNWTPGGTGQSITVSPTVTTSYTVQATDANGCTSAPIVVVVTVRPPLTIAAGPPKSFCPGDSAIISATATGGDGSYFYLWSPGGATTSSIQVTPATTTVYTVVINDGCGTRAVKDSVTITVLPVPVVNLKADTLQGCYPLCVTFKDLSTVTGGASIASWNWNFGDGNSSTQQNPSHCYTAPGIYSVSLSVVSSNGCMASFSIPNYITVYSHPVANFSLSPQPTNIMNPTIYFVDHSTDAYGIINWFWQFGDGTDSVGLVRNPQHTYGDTGSYCVNLEVTNFHGCVTDTTECLEIEPFFVIYVPNAFTPNSNGVNDVFTAKGVGILQYQMWIFDRWGQQIYTTTDIYGGWDGKVQNGASGAQAQEDTYVWLIEVTDVFHKQHRYVGRVSLIK
ncbi:MAG TPA: PKD domain-containing protein, partial [Bacteroidia bacterium]|nr:PKD domain-containing protein [Bacteroidia bacterium]